MVVLIRKPQIDPGDSMPRIISSYPPALQELFEVCWEVHDEDLRQKSYLYQMLLFVRIMQSWQERVPTEIHICLLSTTCLEHSL
jgi:hypothetical protein